MFRSLHTARYISIDVETFDPTIKTLGPGHLRGGFVAGIAIATDEGYSEYYPIAHEMGENLCRNKVITYLNTVLQNKNQPKIGFNIMYDVLFLAQLGVHIKGILYDTQIAAALLLADHQNFSLDRISTIFLCKQKRSDQLYEFLAAAYGGKPERNVQAGRIWRAPATIVKEYAISDVELPLELFEIQQKQLKDQNLWNLFTMESKLLPCIQAMHERGVKIDVDKLDSISEALSLKRAILEAEIKDVVGDINLRSSSQLGKSLDEKELSIGCHKTKKGALSTSKMSLKNSGTEIALKILEWRKINTLVNNYIEGSLREYPINGRIHSFLHSNRSDDGGTITGRFSCSHPNLQAIPKRDEEFGSVVRQMFLPEENEEWVSNDWSQIEYRLLVHYAMGPAAIAARKAYINDPQTDYHQYTHQMVKDATGIDLTRTQVKGINFGLIYGMGVKKLADTLKIAVSEAQKLKEAYNNAIPYAMETARRATKLADRRGFVKTLLGRRRRFETFVPAQFDQEAAALSFNEAVENYGSVKRAHTHKALNSVLQGSSADITKLALLQIWESGVCDIVGSPLITVHDEINFSVPKTKEGCEAKKEIHHIMENCIMLNVPMIVTSKTGNNWGEIE